MNNVLKISFVDFWLSFDAHNNFIINTLKAKYKNIWVTDSAEEPVDFSFIYCRDKEKRNYGIRTGRC